MKKVFFLLFGICFLRLGACDAFASFDFPAKYEVTYTYSKDRPTQVRQHITLTNRFSQLHPTSYQLEIAGELPKNITARDSGGLLKYKITEQSEEKTIIDFQFNRPVVGRGKSYTFDIYYDSFPAKESSHLWEVLIPQAGNLDSNDTYKLHILVPPSFGPLISSNPDPVSTDTTSHPGSLHLLYNATNLTTKSGLAAFGYPVLPVQLAIQYPFQMFPPFFSSIPLEVTNPNHTSIDPQTVTLTSTNLPLSQSNLIIPGLNPDQKIILNLPVRRFFIPQLAPKTITLQVGNEQIPYNIPDYLFITWYVAFITIFTSALIYCGRFAHQAGSIHLQKRRK